MIGILEFTDSVLLRHYIANRPAWRGRPFHGVMLLMIEKVSQA